MGSQKMSSGAFKKMMIGASKGHHSSVKALPHDIKKALKDMHATKYIYNDKLKVSKQEAVKIMKGLKERGLGHHMLTDASSYVHKEFRQEAAHQDTIKRENLANRAKEMAQERQAEAVKSQKTEPTKKTDTHQATAGATTQMAAQATPAVTPKTHSPQHAPTASVPHPTAPPPLTPTMPAGQFHHLPGHSIEAGPTSPTISAGSGIHTQKPPEETIDLAID